MLQKLCSKLRLCSIQTRHHHRLHHFSSSSSSYPPQIVVAAAAHSSAITATVRSTNLGRYIHFLNNAAAFSSSLSRNAAVSGTQRPSLSSSSSLSLMQMRHYAGENKMKSRRPTTPHTSKLKKYKMKPYSSFKSRFKKLNDGTIRRWREGKRHNAHLKSKISKRRLRQPALVHPAYATVMKKLNFFG